MFWDENRLMVLRFREVLATIGFRQALCVALSIFLVFCGVAWCSHYRLAGILKNHVDALIIRDVAEILERRNTSSTEELIDVLKRAPTDISSSLRHQAVMDQAGQILYGNGLFFQKLLKHVQIVQQDKDFVRFTAFIGHEKFVGGRVPLTDKGEYYIVYDIGPMVARLRTLTFAADLMLFAGLFLSLVLGLYFSYRNLHRVEVINRALVSFGNGHSNSRVPANGRDEFSRLGQKINLALDRVNLLVEEVNGASGQIAHELKTPLTRLHNRLASTVEKTQGNLRQDLILAIEDIERVQMVFASIMRIGEIQTGRCAHHFSKLKPAEFVDDLIEYYAPLAEQRACPLVVEVSPGCPLFGDRDLLFQALANLVDNALKYAPPNTIVRIRMEKNDTWTDLSVIDSGSGIPVSQRAVALQRFRRLGNAVNLPGSGLGLPLVKAIASLHRGFLILGEAAPGLVATIRIPLDPQ